MQEFINEHGDSCVKIENIRQFDPADIFECGQCFRFNKISEQYYENIAFKKYIRIKKENNDIIIENTTLEDVKNIWCDYFDLNRNYDEIVDILSKDPIIKKASALYPGIRILKQDPFETTISFIISQNNNIPRIKKIIDTLCREFGEKIVYHNKEFFAFPTFEALLNTIISQIDRLDIIKAGFRTKYIVDFIEKTERNEINLTDIENMSLEDAALYLQKIKGVGPKVSACILLFGYNRLEAFPVDVWIKKVMEKYYPPASSPYELFGEYAGVAQEYLYYYERNLATF